VKVVLRCDTRRVRADNREARAPQLHYDRSPITEALIDLRVDPLPDEQLARFAALPESLRAEYPSSLPRMEVSTHVSAGPQLSTSAKQRRTGTLFVGRDERQIAQFRLDGFTFNRLAPYTDWESVRDAARRLWDSYRLAAPDARVIRVAVRYINRLVIPLPVADLGDYLHIRPELQESLGAMNSFFVHLELEQQDIRAVLLVNEALAEPPADERLAIVFDIDISRSAELPTVDEEIWAVLGELHQRADRVFDESLTPRAKELIS
jgi:uncharacterized protein (TIGR04255 family)